MADEEKKEVTQEGAAEGKPNATSEERLAKLEGDFNALLEVLDRHGINLPGVASDAQGSRGSATKIRKLRGTAK